MNNRWNDRTNLSMLTDFYEMTMSNSYLQNGLDDTIAYFDLYFRSVPEKGGYAVMAGVEQMIDYLETLSFSEENIEYLRGLNCFSEEFLQFLQNFQFSCDVWAVPEGTPLFPSEPIVKVRGPIMQAQMIETMLLLTINHQSLIATKASRIVRAAEGRAVMEFGARRAQGYDASVLGARAAFIGGVNGTSCTICGEQFGIPLSGTMAHSFVQLFDTEYEAFKAYATTYPSNTVLLVDTYNTLKSGIPNAIKLAKEFLEPLGHRLRGVRIDSGDLTYLTQETRRMLDEAGLTDCRITVSNALDEYIIRDLLMQGAKIDSFGVGERLITSRSEPVFGGVYKLAAIERNGKEIPRMKISDNHEKTTTPCNKEVWRLYDKQTGKAIADVLSLMDEDLSQLDSYELFDPVQTWKRKLVKNFRAERMLKPIFIGGELVYKLPTMTELRNYTAEQMDTLWESVKRFENPQTYYVDLSQKLWDIKNGMLHER